MKPLVAIEEVFIWLAKLVAEVLTPELELELVAGLLLGSAVVTEFVLGTLLSCLKVVGA